jgi:hypothetical protein
MPEHPLSTIMKLDPTLMNILNSTDSAVYADGAGVIRRDMRDGHTCVVLTRH